MATVAQGVFLGGLPWNIIAIGAGVAVAVIGLDAYLEHRNSPTRIPVMAFAVGVYLPFHLNVPIFIGGIIAYLVQRTLDKAKASPERRGVVERMGLLAAAGFITGEALIGIGLAIPVAARHDENAVAILRHFHWNDVVTGCSEAGPACHDGTYSALWIPSLFLVATVMFMLYKLALRPDRPGSAQTPTS
jgi:hypothetical protein